MSENNHVEHARRTVLATIADGIDSGTGELLTDELLAELRARAFDVTTEC